MSEPAEQAGAAEALDTSLDFNCPSCGLAVPGGLSYCPRCRAACEGREYDPNEADAHERSYVISLVVLSLGAVAIPRLLRSPAFSPLGKACLTLLGLLNTGAVVGIGYWFFALYLPGMIAQARGG